MKKTILAFLALVLPALPCTDLLFRLPDGTVISLGPLPVGGPFSVNLSATTTGYDGSNGDGKVGISVTGSSAL